ncbi:MAG: hypothetical protein DRP64_19345 [Verrucomicrobia bacterium]|nr:MAG: hypothetical protein DRP64_19345 [Verrucomicrobiota bacterium]
MKIKKLTAVAIIVLLGSLSANAQVIFQDTFNAPDSSWGDVNNDLATRQAGGTTGSTYSLVNSGDPGTSSVIFDNRLWMRIENIQGDSFVSLDTDFGPSLLNTTWTLSFTSFRGGSGVGHGWSAFSVGTNNAPATPFANGFGLIIRGSGGWTAFNGGSVVGDGNLGFAMAHAWYDLTATFDEASNTVSVVMDHSVEGVVNLGPFPTSFGTAGTRFVGLRNFVDAIADGTQVEMFTDDLQIEVHEVIPPPEIGLIAIDQLSGTNALSLTWATGAGYSYTVESKPDLLLSGWTNDITGIVGTGGDVTVTTAVDQAKSFYRVIGE